MKNKLAKIVAVLAVAGLMAAGPVVYAESEGDPPKNGQGSQRGGGPGFMEGLNLDEGQREKFTALQESDKAMTEQMKTKTQELDAVVAEPGTTRSDADYLIDEISTLQAKVLSQKMDRIFALKQILTPEQFEKMQEQDKGPMNQKPGDFWGQNPGPNPEGSGGQNPGSDQY